MRLYKQILTENACYIAGQKIRVKGIMVHSTGANNPRISRYVGPDDGRLGKNQYNNHWNQLRPDGREVCVHGFIGLLADGTVATYQTLPWDHRGWHAGGAANNTHTSFEICEDGLNDRLYFEKVYKEAIELCAYLCKLYALNPLADGVIIGHYEGYQRGIASNHGDPRHWFSRFGKSMDTFRADVARELKNISIEEKKEELTAIMGKAVASAEQMKAFLKNGNPSATAFMDLPELFLEEGEREGVRGDIAFAQSILETGYFKFTGDVKADQNNFSGIGATGGGNPGHRFTSKREGVRAQIQHLLAYATNKTPTQAVVDPRFSLVKRGAAPFVEWLGSKENPQGVGWATGKDYGAKIIRILNSILATKVDAPNLDKSEPEKSIPVVKPPAETIYTVVAGDTLWGIAKKFLGNGNRYPEIKFLNNLSSDLIIVGQKLKIPNGKQKTVVQVGDNVIVTASHYATGERIPDWVKRKPHKVSQKAPGKVLLGHPDGINSWVPEEGVTKAE